MSMALADLNNGTIYPKTEIFEINVNTAGDARQQIPTDIGDKLFFGITKTDINGIITNGTYAIWQNTVANNNEGIGLKIKSFIDGTINVYFGTGGNGGTNLYYSYSINPNGTGGTAGHRLVCFPYGGTFNEDDRWNFGSEQGSFAGSMRIYINKPFPQESELFKVEYSNVYELPLQSSYNAYFSEDKVKHKLDNGRTIQYHKGFNFNADINFEALGTADYADLQDIKNLKANMRFFPNVEEKPNLSYDIIWDNSFATPFTVPTWTGGGVNTTIHLEGIQRLGSVGDII